MDAKVWIQATLTFFLIEIKSLRIRYRFQNAVQIVKPPETNVWYWAIQIKFDFAFSHIRSVSRSYNNMF